MIYKFLSEEIETGGKLEVTHLDGNLGVVIGNETQPKNYKSIILDDHQLYKLIGALHEIQKDIRNERS